ncbi:MAG: hypothetical protein HUU54_13190 [Ignavibacteriaceae bacterium]|nr:hypothetical protein [Ignavibacteriaceae bacterium]
MRHRIKKYTLAGIIVILVVSLALYRLGYIEADLFLSIILAKIITTSNFFLGLFTYDKGLNKDDKSFLLLVLGGQMARIFVVLIFIILGSILLKLNNNIFILVVFIFYFSFLILEIIYLINARSNSLTKYYG